MNKIYKTIEISVCIFIIVFVISLLCLIFDYKITNTKDYKEITLVEEFINSKVVQGNYKGKAGRLCEEVYSIKFKDGEWNCKDRAEFAAIMLLDLGYDVQYVNELRRIEDKKLIGHRFLRVYKDGIKIKDILA